MKINKAYKFRLEPNAEQELVLNKLLGSARFVWNQILAVSFEMLAKNERINKVNWWCFKKYAGVKQIRY